MFDTIHFELQDLKTHDQIYRFLLRQKAEKKTLKLKGDIPLRDSTHWLERDIIFMEKVGEAKETFRVSSMMSKNYISSSHYKLIMFVDPGYNKISFNFSIPKYFFGTNIFQAIPHQGERDYQIMENDFLYQTKIAKRRLMGYLNSFFLKQFPGCYVDFKKIILKRIDLCFNLIFDSKLSALDYLEHQRGVDKKYLRKKNSASNNYQTSIFFSNKDYSAKIYHKGTEFQKNDRVELDKINRVAMRDFGDQRYDGTKKVFDTTALQELADKTLRFEMTFRSAYISKLFNQKILAVGRNNHQKNLTRIYNKLYSISTKEISHNLHGTIIKIPIGMGAERFEYYKDLVKKLYNQYLDSSDENYFEFLARLVGVRPYRDLKNENYYMKVLRKFYYMYVKYLGKSHQIVLHGGNIDPTTWNNYLHGLNNFEHLPQIKFSSDLLKVLFDKFFDFVFDFKLSEMPDISHFRLSLESYNKTAKRPVNSASIILIYSLLKKGYSLKGIKHLIELSDSSYFEYKKFFEYAGITKQSARNLWQPEYSNRQYYNEVFKNNFRKYLEFKFF